MKRIDKAADQSALKIYIRTYPNPVRLRLGQDLKRLRDARAAVERKFLFKIAPKSLRRRMLIRAGAEHLESTRAAYNVYLGRIRASVEYKAILDGVLSGGPVTAPTPQLALQVNAAKAVPPPVAAANVHLLRTTRTEIKNTKEPTRARPAQVRHEGSAKARGDGASSEVVLPDFLRIDGGKVR